MPASGVATVIAAMAGTMAAAVIRTGLFPGRPRGPTAMAATLCPAMIAVLTPMARPVITMLARRLSAGMVGAMVRMVRRIRLGAFTWGRRLSSLNEPVVENGRRKGWFVKKDRRIGRLGVGGGRNRQRGDGQHRK